MKNGNGSQCGSVCEYLDFGESTCCLLIYQNSMSAYTVLCQVRPESISAWEYHVMPFLLPSERTARVWKELVLLELEIVSAEAEFAQARSMLDIRTNSRWSYNQEDEHVMWHMWCYHAKSTDDLDGEVDMFETWSVQFRHVEEEVHRTGWVEEWFFNPMLLRNELMYPGYRQCVCCGKHGNEVKTKLCTATVYDENGELDYQCQYLLCVSHCVDIRPVLNGVILTDRADQYADVEVSSLIL